MTEKLKADVSAILDRYSAGEFDIHDAGARISRAVAVYVRTRG